MYALPDLRDLIIGRIQQYAQLPLEQHVIVDALAPAPCIQLELQINRGVMRLLSAFKKREKERVEQENGLLEQIRSVRILSAKTIDDVYDTAVEIFNKYDPAFGLQGAHEMTSSDRLRNLFVNFFQLQHQKTYANNTLKMVSHPITETTPAVLLGWVSEWSRAVFTERTQETAGAEFARHQQQMRRLSTNRGQLTIIREKSLSPVSHSAFMGRGEQVATPVLTNKESVLGLFLDELLQYYRTLPLDLDFSYPKSMKKLQGRSDFFVDESLDKAAGILIQAKNRYTREQIAQFASECQSFTKRTGKNLFAKREKLEKSTQAKERNSIIRDKSSRKKFSPFQKFFQRVKSESKQEGLSSLAVEKRNSLLLCPKATEISFESSRQIMRKLNRQKQKKELELPQIAPGRVLSTCATNKQKNKYPFFQPNHSIVSNYERYQRDLLKNPIPTKSYDFKQPPDKHREHQRKSKSKQRRFQIQQNPQSRQEGEQLRRNRKLMLQLLREKNKHAFLDK